MLGLLFAAASFIIFAEKRLVILGVIGLIAMPFILPASVWERLASISTLSDSSSVYRMAIYAASLNMISVYWATGIGVGAFPLIYPEFSHTAAYAYHSHNLFLQQFIELGICGFVIFIILLVLAFQRIYFGIKHSTRKYGFLCGGLFAGLSGLILQGMTDNVWHDYRIMLLFWLYMGISIAAVKTGVDKRNDKNNSRING